jgi:hypothetical protein
VQKDSNIEFLDCFSAVANSECVLSFKIMCLFWDCYLAKKFFTHIFTLTFARLFIALDLFSVILIFNFTVSFG